MLNAKEYYILSFNTTTDAMQAEKLLKDNFHIAIMPVPREISSGCGLSIRFQDPVESTIITYLESNPLINGTLYKLTTTRVNGKRETTLLFPSK